MQNLFVYGTLQYPEILQKLTGKNFVSKPAVLNNYMRHKVKHAEYPAIVPKPGAQTMGLLIENVDDLSLRAIDFYEGNEYEKTVVTVFTENTVMDAFTYTWIGGNKNLEEDDWDKNNFEKNFLQLYLNSGPIEF